jgi:hypothetical protein
MKTNLKKIVPWWLWWLCLPAGVLFFYLALETTQLWWQIAGQAALFYSLMKSIGSLIDYKKEEDGRFILWTTISACTIAITMLILSF